MSDLDAWREALEKERTKANMFAHVWYERGYIIQQLNRKIRKLHKQCRRQHQVIKELNMQLRGEASNGSV